MCVLLMLTLIIHSFEVSLVVATMIWCISLMLSLSF